MRAAVWTGYNKIEIQEVPDPQITENEVLVKVMAAGLCATDIEVYSGAFIYGKPPHILGHEIAGEVAALGRGVRDWKKRDRVVIETSVGCGKCGPCRSGQRHLCHNMTEIGYTPHNGGFAQYVKAPAENLVLLPGTVSWDEAGIIESVVCPVGSLMRLGIHFGETVLVYGVGPAGIAFIQGARTMGAGKIIAVARSQDRLERTRQFGASVLVNSAVKDVKTRILEETNGIGADLVCEAAGSAETIATAFDTVRRAGRIILYGIPPQKQVIPLPTINIITNQLEVYGTVGNVNVWEPLLQLVSEGRIDLKNMVSHVLPLSKIREGYAMMQDSLAKPIKVVIHPWDD
jgi:L-iditol 2-dehydrogenase